MQAPPPPQPTRSMQRRGPGSSNDNGASVGHSNPTSSSSVRSSFGGGARSPTMRMETNLSKIEESVTNLLRATKELLETLTKWSRLDATDKEVSDVYVKLGSHFNIACRAFTAIGVETADLGNVPDILRSVLENTLSQEASPQSLEVYLPRIREIIIDLLQGLKRKQKKLGPRANRDANGNRILGDESSSISSSTMSSQSSPRPRGPRVDELAEDARNAPPRSSSLPYGSNQIQYPAHPAPSTHHYPPQAPSRMESTTVANQSIPEVVLQPSLNGPFSDEPFPYNEPYYPPEPQTPQASQAAPQAPQNSEETLSTPGFAHPAAPPAQNALAALQRGAMLERRASHRYSQFQIMKATGSQPGSGPMFATASTPSAAPRVRESRESMEAIRNRGSIPTPDKVLPRTRPSTSGIRRSGTATKRSQIKDQEMASSTPVELPSSPVNETSELLGVQQLADTLSEPSSDSPSIQPPADGYFPKTPEQKDARDSAVTLTDNGDLKQSDDITDAATTNRESSSTTNQAETSKDLTIFLQLGRSIKKVVISDDLETFSLTSLRLLFISKFNYQPPSGEDFPEIYLQDSVSGVRYELEDLHDLKDRAVICLNVEVLDEVKRHIDQGMAGLMKVVESVNQTVQTQGKALQQVADQQSEASKLISDLSTRAPIIQQVQAPRSAPAAIGPAAPTPFRAGRLQSVSAMTRTDRLSQVSDVKTIRRDLAILRQTYQTFVTDVTTNMTSIKAKAASVKMVANNPVLNGASEGRSSLEAGKKMLGIDADTLVARVDDLQDIVEDLRKDVVTRGVRPLPRQIDAVTKEVTKARLELKKMSDYIKREKPLWKKVWERELEIVLEDQQFFNLQEELVADLRDDLDKASQTFELVEQCTDAQLKAAPGAVRAASRGFMPPLEETGNPTRAKDSVMSEVRALQPNHENRLEAIERAERARQKDLETRVSPFKQELGSFVEENKLKKSGGVLEAERLRKQKDDDLRKGLFKVLGAVDTGSAGSDDSLGGAVDTPPSGANGAEPGDIPAVVLQEPPA